MPQSLGLFLGRAGRAASDAGPMCSGTAREGLRDDLDGTLAQVAR